MYEIRSMRGTLIGTSMIKQEALERLTLFPDAHYVVEVHEIRNLVAIKDGPHTSLRSQVKDDHETVQQEEKPPPF